MLGGRMQRENDHGLGVWTNGYMPTEVTFLDKLIELGCFQVSIRARACMRVVVNFRQLMIYMLRYLKFHDRVRSKWAPVTVKQPFLIRESTAYQRLKTPGFCNRAVIPDFYGTVKKTQPALWSGLDMFLEDKLPPNAILIEYIPNMQQIDLSNFSKDRLETLRRILEDTHQARALHGDPMPRNMMVAADRMLWIDFGSAQTFPDDRDIPLPPKQEMWVRNEDEFIENLAGCLL